MEAHKEMKEKIQEQKLGNEEKKMIDPLAKELISKTLVGAAASDQQKQSNKNVAEDADDVLAYSRCVHNIDSSLE
ncbi:hypothetical protein M5689_023128 [Euphorbia peplus]|nr:hypothetical protein M5689_023128 [Euphorbia peplus]